MGVSLQPVLSEMLETSRNQGMLKHEFYNFILASFIKAWSQGRIPRTYIGTAGVSATSIQVERETYDQICAISKADGVSASTVIRTAFAWWLFKSEKKSDPYGTDIVFSTPRDEVIF